MVLYNKLQGKDHDKRNQVQAKNDSLFKTQN